MRLTHLQPGLLHGRRSAFFPHSRPRAWPGLKLFGFKGRSELAFEDNAQHSIFIYPDERTYAGSWRTFVALLSSMMKEKAKSESFVP